MTQQKRRGATEPPQRTDDPTFKRHGPEPPENDSGPSPEPGETGQAEEPQVRNVDPAQQVD